MLTSASKRLPPNITFPLTGMLTSASKRLPPNVTMEIADLSKLPLYNDDLWQVCI